VFLFERAVAGHVVEHLEFAFRAVEQSGEHQGQIEVGEAKPFDAALFGDERGGPAITDDTVIEIIFHRRFSCWSAGSSRLSRRSAPPRTNVSRTDPSVWPFWTNVVSRGSTSACRGRL